MQAITMGHKTARTKVDGLTSSDFKYSDVAEVQHRFVRRKVERWTIEVLPDAAVTSFSTRFRVFDDDTLSSTINASTSKT